MINETTEGQEAGEQREELFFKVIEAGNKILEILAALFIILMLLYGAYSLWDTCQINRRAFISGELMKYKPAGKTDESPSLQELQKINPDVCAWLTVDGTKIDYPVVQGSDNSEYLSKTFKGYDNTVGTIFVNAYNHADFNDRNTIIYGHYMYNGTMFNELEQYHEKSFWEKYPSFYIYTPDGNVATYQIYSVGVVKDTSEGYTYQFADDAAFASFLEATKASSLYDTGVEVGNDSQIVTLSTCTREGNDDRTIVHGVRVNVQPAGE